MRTTCLALVVALTTSLSILTNKSPADTFGSGANQFDIEFVNIGDPGNPTDTTGAPNPAGSVPYAYRIAKYEVSRDMVTKANSAGGLGITLSDLSFFDNGQRPASPAVGVSWIEAAQFVNWLNTSSGHAPAYKFNGGAFALWQSGDVGYDPANPFRNTHAFYFLPSADEWYKAAYYDPAAGVYYDYPTGSDTVPTGITSGTTAGTAVWNQLQRTGPADITLAGGLSPYGTMGQGGNVWEWEETAFDLDNNSASSNRGVRGAAWDNFVPISMHSSDRSGAPPSFEEFRYGFRVAAAIPEPSAVCLAALGTFGLFLRRRLVPAIR